MNFIEVKEKGESRLINLDKIAYIRPAAEPGKTIIVFIGWREVILVDEEYKSFKIRVISRNR